MSYLSASYQLFALQHKISILLGFRDLCFPLSNVIAKQITSHICDVVDMQGNVLGQHPGIINFTIGQRRRLYINSLVPKYVVKIIPETRQVVVGDKEDLQRKKVYLKEINWLSDVPMHLYNKPIGVKIRSSNVPMNAWVKFSNPEDQYIELGDSEYGISPGQACVMYDGTRVLGGGWIVETS